jgi:hypothetical protein
MITIILIIILLELSFRPRLDHIEDFGWLIWYGKKQRKFIKL